MKLFNGLIINAPSYVLPAYRISPFRTIDACKNKIFGSLDNDKTELYLSDKFEGKKLDITESGRSALGIALSMLKLKPDDVVTIITTTNKFYISGCVTKEIEKHCQWSRKIEKNTKVILINHEFGFCHQNIKKYIALGYPVIEDFAHSFVSDSINNDAGHNADFSIFSFSKFFPVQIGGALIYDKKYNNLDMKNDFSFYTKNVVANYIDTIPNIKIKRLENYYYYLNLFDALDIQPYFKLQENDCPGVFCFKVPDQINLNDMKVYMNSNGIESSIFYGENAYFLPCHQNLEKCDMDYIFTVFKCYLETNYDFK